MGNFVKKISFLLRFWIKKITIGFKKLPFLYSLLIQIDIISEFHKDVHKDNKIIHKEICLTEFFFPLVNTETYSRDMVLRVSSKRLNLFVFNYISSANISLFHNLSTRTFSSSLTNFSLFPYLTMANHSPLLTFNVSFGCMH